MEKDKTKPCPFCGGRAVLVRNGSYWNDYYYVRVECEMCGSQGKTFRTKVDPSKHEWNTRTCFKAIEAWNTRAKTE